METIVTAFSGKERQRLIDNITGEKPTTPAFRPPSPKTPKKSAPDPRKGLSGPPLPPSEFGSSAHSDMFSESGSYSASTPQSMPVTPQTPMFPVPDSSRGQYGRQDQYGHGSNRRDSNSGYNDRRGGQYGRKDNRRFSDGSWGDWEGNRRNHDGNRGNHDGGRGNHDGGRGNNDSWDSRARGMDISQGKDRHWEGRDSYHKDRHRGPRDMPPRDIPMDRDSQRFRDRPRDRDHHRDRDRDRDSRDRDRGRHRDRERYHDDRHREPRPPEWEPEPPSPSVPPPAPPTPPRPKTPEPEKPMSLEARIAAMLGNKAPEMPIPFGSPGEEASSSASEHQEFIQEQGLMPPNVQPPMGAIPPMGRGPMTQPPPMMQPPPLGQMPPMPGHPGMPMGQPRLGQPPMPGMVPPLPSEAMMPPLPVGEAPPLPPPPCSEEPVPPPLPPEPEGPPPPSALENGASPMTMEAVSSQDEMSVAGDKDNDEDDCMSLSSISSGEEKLEVNQPIPPPAAGGAPPTMWGPSQAYQNNMVNNYYNMYGQQYPNMVRITHLKLSKYSNCLREWQLYCKWSKHIWYFPEYCSILKSTCPMSAALYWFVSDLPLSILTQGMMLPPVMSQPPANVWSDQDEEREKTFTSVINQIITELKVRGYTTN